MQGIRVVIPIECIDRLIGLLESDAQTMHGDSTDDEIAAFDRLIKRLEKTDNARRRKERSRA